MTAREIIQDLLSYLPDADAHILEVDPNHSSDWAYAWDELCGDCQAAVKAARNRATQFLQEMDQ